MSEWKLVPVEPTAGMLAAGVAAESNAPTHVQERLTLYAYRAMLAAAPTPPADAVTDAMQSAGEAAYDKVLRSTDDRSRVVRAAITAALAAKETGRD